METQENSGDLNLQLRDKKKPRKRTKLSKKRNETFINSPLVSSSTFNPRITQLPVEILLEIFSYLNPCDLYNLRKVCRIFEHVVGNPAVWRTFKVTGNEINTFEVIKELQRMPLLKKFTLDARTDSDDILRQISLTNKNLEELYIINCTGSTAKLYLKSLYLIKILEKCTRLHTINIEGTRFRGVKFYKLLADMGLRLRVASTPATCLQLKTFANNALHISEEGRQAITEMCLGVKNWASLNYCVIDHNAEFPTAFISYLDRDVISVYMWTANNLRIYE